VLLLVLSVHMVYVALPERYFDALALHLRLPTVVAQEGRWSYDCTTFAGSVMPLNADAFYTVGYLLGGEGAARLVDFLFFAMILALLYGELGSRLGTSHALLFAALLASAPVAFIETGSLFVENVLATFLFAGFVVWMRSREQPRRADALVVALLLGAGASTKLHGAVFALLLGAVVAVEFLRRCGLRETARSLWPAVVAGGLLALPPYLHAYWVTGNPVFPFCNGLFRSPYFPAWTLHDPRWGRLAWNLPYMLTFRSHFYFEAADGSFGFHFLVLGLAGLVVGLLRRDRLVAWAALLGVGFFLATAWEVVHIRYLYPVCPLFVVVCSGVYLVERGRRAVRWLAGGLTLLLIGLNLYYLPAAGWILPSFDTQALFSRGERCRLLDRTAPERRLVEAVNAMAGSNARVVFASSPYATGLQGKPYFLVWYNPTFCVAFNNAPGPEAIRHLFRHVGATHAILHAAPDLPNRAALVEVLQRHATPVMAVQDATLYTLHLD
jgi:hypothetical protein